MEPNRYKKTLSQNLKIIRKSKGLTTVDLAKILGVSQAKISYIEHCKGDLSAEDVALLSRRLNIPITEFFRGLAEPEDESGIKELTGHLVRYGAILLAKPPGISLKAVPFETVFTRSLGFIEDDRLHKGFCAALVIQAASTEINVDRIFAVIGNNPFLIRKTAEEAGLCLQVIGILNRSKIQIGPRATEQLKKIKSVALDLLGVSKLKDKPALSVEELADLTKFVGDCHHAKR